MYTCIYTIAKMKVHVLCLDIHTYFLHIIYSYKLEGKYIEIKFNKIV